MMEIKNRFIKLQRGNLIFFPYLFQILFHSILLIFLFDRESASDHPFEDLSPTFVFFIMVRIDSLLEYFHRMNGVLLQPTCYFSNYPIFISRTKLFLKTPPLVISDVRKVRVHRIFPSTK